MNERIQNVLDGELSRDVLTPEEMSRLAEVEAMVRGVTRVLPNDSAPDLTARVMARIDALEAAKVRDEAARERPSILRSIQEAVAWLWRPRAVALRPAWGFAAAAFAVLLLITSSRDAVVPPMADVSVSEARPAEIFVHFRFDAPEASSVHLAGDFTEWKPQYVLNETQPGVWTVVVPLQAGVHDYAFVIDGERWLPDPLATRVDDGFGGENSRLSILPPERVRA